MIEQCEGYRNLLESVLRDTCQGSNCFHPDGCNRPVKVKVGCFHDYCNKFKWAIDRTLHYAEHTGIPATDILTAWERQRTYWYMNFYQDRNQPLITQGKVKVFNTVEDMLASIGNPSFRCPACSGVSTSPYACNSGLEMSKGKICDWKSYGLFGPLGKGIHIFVKDRMKIEEIFMPIAWEPANTGIR